MLYPRAYLYFSLVFVLAIVAFTPTYFMRPGDAGPAHHFHAAVAAAWMLMLISQSWAISHRRVVLHRAAGKGSYVLAPLFIAASFAIIHAMQNGGGPFREMFGAGLSLADALAVAAFAWFYFQAIANRRNMQLHARYMTATVLMLLNPVLARILSFHVPGFLITSVEEFGKFPLNFHLGNAMALSVTLALLYSDRKSAGVSRPYLVAASVIVLQSISFQWVAPAGWWQSSLATFGAVPVLAASMAGLFIGVALVAAATLGNGRAARPRPA